MICLTGDLHHHTLGTGNQKHCDLRENQVARRYLDLLERANVKVTFFISGKSFLEEWEDIGPIVAHPLVEVGGHNWSCFTPELWHRFSKKVFGSYNGPAWYQRRDAVKTMGIAERLGGKRIAAWRNHMYMHGPHTEQVLAEAGIRVCSDGGRRDAAGPVWTAPGIWDLKINVIPDHEHLYHAERTPEWVAWWKKRYRWADDWGPDSYGIEEWVEIALDDLRRNEERGAVSTLIIHPITMYLCDRFACFERLLDYISRRETVHVSEVIAHAEETRRAEETRCAERAA